MAGKSINSVAGATKYSDREVREKLLLKGVEALTDSELLSVLLRDGGPDGIALEHANALLDAFEGGLPAMSVVDINRLRLTASTGLKRAVTLLCAFEIGRRAAQGNLPSLKSIGSPEDVTLLFGDRLTRLQYEEFWVVFLSTANTVLDKVKVGQGGVSGVVVDHRLIVKRAIELLASSLILVHNHPSGVARPSEDDKALTRKIAEASLLFDITVIDHIILTSTNTFSFRANGLI